MSNRRDSGSPEPEQIDAERAVEKELLDRVKAVARRIVERVRKLTEDTAPGPVLRPDEPTGEAPPI